MGSIITEKSVLSGEVKISGAKNSALPLLAATLLTEEEVVLHKVPVLADIETMVDILRTVGKKVIFEKDTNTIRISGPILHTHVSYDLVRKMRASFNVLGPIAVMMGEASTPLPGGCAIGVRPVDFHIEGLKRIGFDVTYDHGEILAKRGTKPEEVTVYLPFPSVGATEHVMSTAALLPGITIIENAAMEPEINDLQDLLNKMGAKVTGAGTSRIVVEGVRKLHGCEHTVIPDRIEAGTYAIAFLATGGEGVITDVEPSHLDALWFVLERTGAIVKKGSNFVELKSWHRWKSCDINVLPYPGFPTDLQPQIIVYLALAQGTSTVTENVFKTRFAHVGELVRMGADMKIMENTVFINGVEKLEGTTVMGTDLRATAALVIAGLAAEGTTEVTQVEHIFRGYEHVVEKFSKIGGKLRYVPGGVPEI
ncbi:MAG: UDP-N-acetylglucosamine 1-carboxyvinyltransferase [Fervidobacterium sp.]|uniref:UDP-N-acetylglucosamine 1-carboxyvinyltransferase n=1 Tax=Fervidobacterium gondwanense DSM 13020 TaxID=1121883 RepID=A0A1M7RU07_FERGO|nr:UDP-N-acetylglucosamine 1-carboxyvinyltransferase [Fervidobacterium gondwanense]UXF01882.1 UDP-N-acetylglucosamine 1-carboxyvinyltransferase [Fervidobacterium riparium]SHN49626.1 UDP-N-acetylglucosamine 1-carboxyvinyltransferase [Fervidobacterium gondwanense DSM 13020]